MASKEELQAKISNKKASQSEKAFASVMGIPMPEEQKTEEPAETKVTEPVKEEKPKKTTAPKKKTTTAKKSTGTKKASTPPKKEEPEYTGVLKKEYQLVLQERKSVRKNMLLYPSLCEKLEEVAKDKGISFNDLVNKVLVDYVESL